MSNDKCCGTCKYYHEYIGGAWLCVNDQSEYCVEWTEYDDSCDEWEGRGNLDE